MVLFPPQPAAVVPGMGVETGMAPLAITQVIYLLTILLPVAVTVGSAGLEVLGLKGGVVTPENKNGSTGLEVETANWAP